MRMRLDRKGEIMAQPTHRTTDPDVQSEPAASLLIGRPEVSLRCHPGSYKLGSKLFTPHWCPVFLGGLTR